jgi:uncharacterized membrane protein
VGAAELAIAIGGLVLQLSCSDDPAGTGPTGVDAVSLSPGSATVVARDTVRFTATVTGQSVDRRVQWLAVHGVVDAAGLYTAPGVAGRDTVRAVSVADSTKAGVADITVLMGIDAVVVSPESATVVVGDTVRFSASVTGANPDHRVQWRTLHGVIDSAGLYTAPPVAGHDTVRAISLADSAKTRVALVLVLTGIDAVVVTPDSATVFVGDRVRFSATVSGRNPDHRVRWRAVHGAIDSTGLYAAPATASSDTVRVFSVADSTKAGVADITVLTGIDAVVVSPESATVVVGDTVRFSASVTGANPDHRVQWRAVLGSVDSTGLYRAPNAGGYDTVTAASAVDAARVAAVAVTVQALVAFAGQLQDLDHVGIQGTLVAYEVQGTDTVRLVTRSSDSLGFNRTDSRGNFGFRIARSPSQVGDLVLMARQGTPEDYQGYVRTIHIPARDSGGIVIRAVPYPPGITPTDFAGFMFQLTQADSAFWPPRIRFDLRGEYVSNREGLKRIRILDHGYFGDSTSTFTVAQQNNMRSKILDPTDISGIIGNYAIDSTKIVFGNDTTDYGVRWIDSSDPAFALLGSWSIAPKLGVIVVAPKTDRYWSGLAVPVKTGASLVTGGTVYMKGGGSNGLISHEFAHLFLGLGHNTILDLSQTVMRISGNTLTTTGPADKAAGRLIYEPTFMTVLPWFGFWSVDLLGHVLGLDFK